MKIFYGKNFTRKILAMGIVFSLIAGILPIPVLNSVQAAGKAPATRAKDWITYFVDCGDYVTNTVCTGDQLGTNNSVTDKAYGEDATTGYKWGIVDDVSSPLKNGSSSCGGAFTDNTWPYESNPAGEDMTSKTDSNRYTKNQYENGVEVRYMDYKFELEAGRYEIETYTKDPWSCSKNPTLLINSSDAMKDFKDGKGKKMTAENVVKETVTMETDGDLLVSFRASGDDNKAINVCYITITDLDKKEAATPEPTPTQGPTEPPVDYLELDYTALKFPGMTITENLNLPGQGKNGSSIEWSSSDEDVISNGGEVERPEVGKEDKEVILTAKLSYNGKEKYKLFTFTVLADNLLTGLEQFNLSDVEILDQYYLDAQNSDIDFLKKFDNDRLLSRYRETAGLDKRGKNPYRGWEDSYLGGHSLGHYLAACAQAVQATGDEELEEKLEDLVDGLKECQDALGTGFVFGAKVYIGDVEKQFDIVEGKGSGETWVPWYNLHKTLAGLLETYKLTGNKTALDVVSKLGVWVYNRVSKWSASARSRVIGGEQGGMNDSLYELYQLSDDTRHRDAAQQFDDPNLFKAIVSDKGNTINGRHANATIPEIVGALNGYKVLEPIDELTNDSEAYFDYAKIFWDLVVYKHSYITGGVSDMEHFRNDNTLDNSRSACNNESCCAHNMLRLSRELYKITGDWKYAEYYENTLRNTIMGSIDTTNGATNYFSPMASGYYKIFGEADPANNMFWCCTGSGMENFTKLGDSIYFYTDNALVVNQYVASKVQWDEGNMEVTQDSDVTRSENAEFEINLLNGKTSQNATIYLRKPEWIAGDAKVEVNGKLYTESKVSGGYIAINREWKTGDNITFTYPMKVTAVSLPDNDAVFGFKYGPTVLAARLGTDRWNSTTWAGANLNAPLYKVVGSEFANVTITYGQTAKKVLGTETLKVTDEDASLEYFINNINDYMEKSESSDTLSFRLNGTDADDNFLDGLEFVPYNTLNDERYGVYWYFSSKFADEESKILQEKQEGRITNSIIDSLRAGYSQYELDPIHDMKEENTDFQYVDGGSSSRWAKSNGYFTYNMIVNKDKTNSIVCQFAKEDNGKTIKIEVGNTVLVNETLNYQGGDTFYQISYPISNQILNANVKEITVAGDKYTVVPVTFRSGSSTEDSARVVGGLSMVVNYNEDTGIVSITSDVGKVEKAPIGDSYTILVPKSTTEVKAKINIADQWGLLYIDNLLVNDSKAQAIKLKGETTQCKLKVYAEDHETNREYTLSIKKDDTLDTTPPPTQTLAPSPTPGNSNDVAKANAEFDKTAVKPSSVTIYKGKSSKITVEYTNALKEALKKGTMFVKQVTYSSDKKSVATVNNSGVITGKKAGKAKVTVTLVSSTGKTLKKTVNVTVKNPTIKITGAKTIKVGKKLKLKAKLFGLSGKVKWSVNNKKRASIQSNGTLKAKKSGKVKVTAKVKKIKKTVTIKIKKK